jgi:amidase
VVVAPPRRAGAIFIGKTNVPEFGLGSHSFNTVFGATGNAWNPAFTAGGSSGGAAAAVALRMLPFADGSDLGGSLRNPAAYNNILGLRPSQGRVPHWPRAETFLDQLVTEGPLARSADDLALLLAVQAGYDARVPLSLAGGIADWHDQLQADLRGQRIAWLGDLGGYLPFEPGIIALCEATLARFAASGLTVAPVAPAFDWPGLWRAFVVLRQFGIGNSFATAYDTPATRALMKPELQWEIEQSRRLTVADVQLALNLRTAWYDAALELFGRYDFLALPTAQVFPFPIEQRWPEAIAGRPMDSYHRWMEVVVPGTLSGCPVISLPAGFGAAGLPMGVQIIGRPRDDLSVLRIAHLYEKLTNFLTMAPPEFGGG